MTDQPPGEHPVIQAIRERHSSRAFLPQSISSEDLDQLFTVAQQAPSWCNTQPWRVTLLSGADVQTLSAALVKAVTAHREPSWEIEPPTDYVGEHRARRVEAGVRLYQAVGVARGDLEGRRVQHLRNFEFFNAPHVAILMVDEALGPYAYVDAGVYLGVLLTTAESMGIATIAQAAIAGHSAVLRSVVDLPEDSKVVCAIALGREDRTHPANSFRTSRAESHDVVSLHGK